MTRAGAQQKLFDMPEHLKTGLVYRPHFVSEREEDNLLYAIGALSLKRARFREYATKRFVKGFGWGWDFEEEKFIPGPPLPEFLEPLARKIAKWLDIPRKRVAEALINEYPPGTSIGWHRDSEAFEHIVGVSLNGWCRMRFRPVRSKESGIPAGLASRGRASNGIRPLGNADGKPVTVELEPRSAYVMQKDIRWKWQHSIAPTKAHRWSITFRTLPKSVRA